LGDCYCIDGMHPNEKGHAMIAEAVLASGVLGEKA
jgi:lysophospholipase L1-like esterase